MCASLLRQFQIQSVFFGCANERFGGTGGVLCIHADEMGVGGGDGGKGGYKAYGGIFGEEAVMLLRRFYVQDNGRVPEEKARKKERELKEVRPGDIHLGVAGKVREGGVKEEGR